MCKSITAYLVIGLLLSTALPSMGAFGGLVVIPTADVLDLGDYSLEAQVDRSNTTETWLINTERGFGGRTEAGIDFELNRSGKVNALFNVKHAFFESGKANLVLSAGIYSAPPNVANVPYVVASKCFGVFRLHVGGQYNDAAGQWFAGVDHALNGRWTVMADYTQGEQNFSSVGVNYQLSKALGVLIGGQFPNDGGDTLYSVQLSLGGNYRLCPRSN